MKINSNRLYGLGLSVLLAGMTVEALAGSTFTVTELPAEGNVRCNDYALNGLIDSVDTTNPEQLGTLTNGTQIVDYYFTENVDGSTDWTSLNFDIQGSSENIDYAVLKAETGRDVTILMYPSGGTPTDTYMIMTSPVAIGAFSLCYGLDNEELSPPSPPYNPPRCEDVSVLQDTVIDCEDVGGRRIIASTNLDTPEGEFEWCTCNVAAGEASECDSTLTVADGQEFVDNGCPSGSPLNATPHGSFFIPDGTTYCWDAANGKRKCVTF